MRIFYAITPCGFFFTSLSHNASYGAGRLFSLFISNALLFRVCGNFQCNRVLQFNFSKNNSWLRSSKPTVDQADLLKEHGILIDAKNNLKQKTIFFHCVELQFKGLPVNGFSCVHLSFLCSFSVAFGI